MRMAEVGVVVGGSFTHYIIVTLNIKLLIIFLTLVLLS